MSVLYCTVPDRVKSSTVIADEYRKVTEKIDYWRTDLRYNRSIYQPSTSFVFFVCFFCLGGGGFKKGETFLKLKSHVVDSADPDQTPQNCYTVRKR